MWLWLQRKHHHVLHRQADGLPVLPQLLWLEGSSADWYTRHHLNFFHLFTILHSSGGPYMWTWTWLLYLENILLMTQYYLWADIMSAERRVKVVLINDTIFVIKPAQSTQLLQHFSYTKVSIWTAIVQNPDYRQCHFRVVACDWKWTASCTNWNPNNSGDLIQGLL